jgi:hypothetical protein
MRYAKWFCVALSVIVFVSCLGIEMETKFNTDGSGEMMIRILVSQELLEMGEEGTAGVALPLSEEEIEEAYSNVDGVVVQEVTQEETEKDRIITAKISFKNFNKFAQHEEFPGEGASIREIDGNTEFTMTVGQANEDVNGSAEQEDGAESAETLLDSMDESMVAMIQAFMEGYFVEYRIVAPKKIMSYTDGELGSDGKSVTFKIPMGEYFMIQEPYDLTVMW